MSESLHAVVLAGGLGTRLRGVISDLPKPLAPVAGRPFLTWLLDDLARQGYQLITLAVGYRAALLQDTIGDEYQGMQVRYAVEDEPLGTGGGIRYALQSADADTPVTVLNGDTYLRVDLSAMRADFMDSGADCSLALVHLHDFDRYGVVNADERDRITAFHEKSPRQEGWINGGVYLLRPSLLERQEWPARFSFERDLLETHIHDWYLRAFRTSGYFIDIGVPDDYARAQWELPQYAGVGGRGLFP